MAAASSGATSAAGFMPRATTTPNDAPSKSFQNEASVTNFFMMQLLFFSGACSRSAVRPLDAGAGAAMRRVWRRGVGAMKTSAHPPATFNVLRCRHVSGSRAAPHPEKGANILLLCSARGVKPQIEDGDKTRRRMEGSGMQTGVMLRARAAYVRVCWSAASD